MMTNNTSPFLSPFIVAPHFSCDAVPVATAPRPQILDVLIYSWSCPCTPVWCLCISWATEVILFTGLVQRLLPLSQTFTHALMELFISGALYGQGIAESSFTIPRRVRQCGRDLKIWWGVPMWTRWWPAHLMRLTQRRHQQEIVTFPLLWQRGQERALKAVMMINPHLPKRARMTNQSKV